MRTSNRFHPSRFSGIRVLMLAVSCAIIPGCGGGGDGGETSAIPSGSLIAAFGQNGIVQNNVSALDVAWSVIVHSSGLYVVGSDRTPGNAQWRIERRDLGSGALDSGFGNGGVVTANTSAFTDAARHVAFDLTYMYTVGFESSTATDTHWVIEKRLISDGTYQTVDVSDPAAGVDAALAVTVDPTEQYLYIVGIETALVGDPDFEHTRWRIEKRLTSNLSLDLTFGQNGAVVVDQGVVDHGAGAIVADASSIYVAGSDSLGSVGNRLRVEKRDSSTGSLDSSFGTNGVYLRSDQAGFDSYCEALILDSGSLYLVGSVGGGWHIEKVSATDGTPDGSFGSAGVVTHDPDPASEEYATGAVLYQGGLYVVGYEVLSVGDVRWSIRKYDATTGSLITSFGSAGSVTTNPTDFADGHLILPLSIGADATGIYLGGTSGDTDNSSGSIYLEKRTK